MVVRAPVPPPDPTRRPPGFLARTGPAALSAAAGWSAAAAVAHLVRYGVLSAFADRLVPVWLEFVTVGLVWCVGVVAFLAGVVAVVCATEWLVARRRAAYAPAVDHRRPWALRLLCWAPVVTLVYPAVFLTELRAVSAGDPLFDDDVAARRIRRWWAVWVVNAVLVVAVLALSTVDGQQAAADRVLLTAVACAASAVTAWLARGVTRDFSDTSPRFTRRYLARGIV